MVVHMGSFFPKNKEVPTELIFDNIKVRQLKSTDNELDYLAVIESGFRSEGFPKEENLEQITRHEQDHNDRKEFAFTILDKDETVCYGCLFIKPIVPFLKFAFFNDRLFKQWDIEEIAPGFSFWITPTGWNLGLYKKLLFELSKWFKSEWVYEKWYLLGMRLSEEELAEIEKLNLKQKFLFQMEEQKYILWQLF
ncbi:hypothetical protein ES705_07912 [subsurface metagenome]